MDMRAIINVFSIIGSLNQLQYDKAYIGITSIYPVLRRIITNSISEDFK